MEVRMKVVLTQEVPKLGLAGETRDVATGFAKNYLLPNKLAVSLDHPGVKMYRRKRQEAALQSQAERSMIKTLAEQWEGTAVTISAKASPDGTLYGSIGAKQLLKALGRNDINLSIDDPIKKIGKHSVKASFTDGTAIQILVTVSPEN